MKDIIVFGGPNGAGKTTAAYKLLPMRLEIREFVNADEIARGLSPFNAESSAVAAGRLMLQRLQELAQAEVSFAFETTCAGRGHVRFLEHCRTLGYRLTLAFYWLPSPDMAVARVAQRVREGGHDIPETVIRRRYHAGLHNMLHLYLPVAAAAFIIDNSDGGGALIAERRREGPLIIHDSARWRQIKEMTR